jgi:hypothetical protein
MSDPPEKEAATGQVTAKLQTAPGDYAPASGQSSVLQFLRSPDQESLLRAFSHFRPKNFGGRTAISPQSKQTKPKPKL